MFSHPGSFFQLYHSHFKMVRDLVSGLEKSEKIRIRTFEKIESGEF